MPIHGALTWGQRPCLIVSDVSPPETSQTLDSVRIQVNATVLPGLK